MKTAGSKIRTAYWIIKQIPAKFLQTVPCESKPYGNEHCHESAHTCSKSSMPLVLYGMLQFPHCFTLRAEDSCHTLVLYAGSRLLQHRNTKIDPKI